MPGSSRGIAMLAAAVILGLFLLSRTENPSPVVVATGASSTSTTVPRSTSTTAASTTPTTVRHDPAQVNVLVLNGVDKKKAIAGPAAKALVNAGFTQATGKDAANTVETSVVYAITGYEGDGTVVAGLLGIPPASVKPLPTPLPPEIGDPGDAQIIVVLGPDAPVSTG